MNKKEENKEHDRKKQTIESEVLRRIADPVHFWKALYAVKKKEMELFMRQLKRPSVSLFSKRLTKRETESWCICCVYINAGDRNLTVLISYAPANVASLISKNCPNKRKLLTLVRWIELMISFLQQFTSFKEKKNRRAYLLPRTAQSDFLQLPVEHGEIVLNYLLQKIKARVQFSWQTSRDWRAVQPDQQVANNPPPH